MKFTQILINIGIGVAGFFAFALLQNAANGAFWIILLFAAIAAAGYFLRNTASSEVLLSVWTYLFSYGCIYAFLGVIKWLSERVLSSIQFNSFFKGLLLFIVSLLVFSLLASYIKKGVKAIIAFKDWKEDPAWNFQTIAFGFLCLLGLVWWIAGVVECGLAGALSFLGIVLAFVPNDLLDTLTSVPEAPQPQQNAYRDEVTMDDGTVIRQNSDGDYVDSNDHLWKKDASGNWYDDGYRMGMKND